MRLNMARRERGRRTGFLLNEMKKAGCVRGRGSAKGRQHMSDKGGGFGWFLVGLGIGAAVGVLYAPKAGYETREDLASSAREGTEYMREQSRRAAEKVSDFADCGRDQLNEYVDRG